MKPGAGVQGIALTESSFAPKMEAACLGLTRIRRSGASPMEQNRATLDEVQALREEVANELSSLPHQ